MFVFTYIFFNLWVFVFVGLIFVQFSYYCLWVYLVFLISIYMSKLQYIKIKGCALVNNIVSYVLNVTIGSCSFFVSDDTEDKYRVFDLIY